MSIAKTCSYPHCYNIAPQVVVRPSKAYLGRNSNFLLGNYSIGFPKTFLCRNSTLKFRKKTKTVPEKCPRRTSTFFLRTYSKTCLKTCLSKKTKKDHSKSFLSYKTAFMLQKSIETFSKPVLAAFKHYGFEKSLKRLQIFVWDAIQPYRFENVLHHFQNRPSRNSILLLAKQPKPFPKQVVQQKCFETNV